MPKIVIHENPDGSVWYEGLSSTSPIPAGKMVVEAATIRGKKPEYMRIVNGVLIEDAALKAAYLGRDRRTPFEKLVDLMESDGILTKQKADLLRGNG